MGKEIQLEKEGGGVGFQEISLKNVSKNYIYNVNKICPNYSAKNAWIYKEEF